MKERRKNNLIQHRTRIAIIVGLLTIIVIVGGLGINIISWRDNMNFLTSSTIGKNDKQDERLEAVEKATHKIDISIERIDTNIQFIKEALQNLRGSK